MRYATPDEEVEAFRVHLKERHMHPFKDCTSCEAPPPSAPAPTIETVTDRAMTPEALATTAEGPRKILGDTAVWMMTRVQANYQITITNAMIEYGEACVRAALVVAAPPSGYVQHLIQRMTQRTVNGRPYRLLNDDEKDTLSDLTQLREHLAGLRSLTTVPETK